MVCMVMMNDSGAGDTAFADDHDALGADPFIALARAHTMLDEYEQSDFTQVDDEWFALLVGSVERLRTRADRLAIDVATEAKRRGHERERGFSSVKAYIAHHGRLSGPEALGRQRTMHMFDLLPGWERAAREGDIGVEQIRLMARTASNPRITEIGRASCRERV